jgi:hypothetical protein
MHALGDIAFGNRDELRSALNKIRARYFRAGRMVKTIGHRTEWLQMNTTRLLESAARVAERGGKREKLVRLAEEEALHGAGRIPRHFEVRLKPRSPKPVVEVVVPSDQDEFPLDAAMFYVTFAFWSAACEVPVASWRTFLLRHCAVCGEGFRDLRPVMRHGPKKRCDSCRADGRRKRR